MAKEKDLYILIVTGLSGTGKSNALGALEDMGFVCADNLPCQLVKEYLDLCASDDNDITRVALVLDCRESVFGYNPLSTYNELLQIERPYEIMFLECEDTVLMHRYSGTRRRHPMCDDVSDGIALERAMLAPLKEKANYIIDTTNMTPVELGRTIEGILLRGEYIPLRLIVSSFGFKRGLPYNADYVFDMRYTPNPFYVDELRHLSGRDEKVKEYVFSDPSVRTQLDMIENMLRLTIPEYKKQGKRRLMIAFGCTGGRHRSVAMAEALHDRLSKDFPVMLEHRDLDLEACDIKERFNTK